MTPLNVKAWNKLSCQTLSLLEQLQRKLAKTKHTIEDNIQEWTEELLAETKILASGYMWNDVMQGRVVGGATKSHLVYW